MALRGLTLCPNGAALVYYGAPLRRDPRVYLEDILRKLCRELTPSLTMRPYLQVSRTWGQGCKNIVGRDRSADATALGDGNVDDRMRHHATRQSDHRTRDP